MNKITYALLLLFITHFSFAQYSACSKYGGDYNRIKNEMIKRAKAKNMLYNGKDDGIYDGSSKWDESTIGKMAERWVKICKCEKGVPESEWQSWQKHNELNKISFQGDNFIWKGVYHNKDKSIFGDLAPPNRIFISSDCIKGKTNNTEVSHTDCWNDWDMPTPEQDPQQFIKSFVIAHCMCKKGVQNDQQAKNLSAQMQSAYDNVKTYYPNTTYKLKKPLSPEECTKISKNADGDLVFTTGEKGKILNSELQNFIGKLAAETDNPDIKKLSQDLNNIDKAFKETFEFDAMWGKANASDLEAYNQVESVAQAIALGVFVYNLTKKNEPQLSSEQVQAKNAIQNMLRNINSIYQEVKYVPHFYEYDQKVLDRLNEKVNLFNLYEKATAVERALYFKYLWSSPDYTIDELKKEYSVLKTKSHDELIQIIQSYQNKTKGIENVKQITNNNIAFEKEMFKINYEKANCYEALGDAAMAQKIRSNLKYETADLNLIVHSLQEGILHYNNAKAIKAYVTLKTHIQKKGVWNVYNEFNSLMTPKIKGLKLADALYLLSLGSLAYTRDKQFNQAKTELDFLADFNNRTLEWYNKEKDKWVRKSKQLEHERFTNEILNAFDKGLTYEKATRSYYLSEVNRNEEALVLINEALAIKPRNQTVVNSLMGLDPSSNLHFLKFKVLINSKLFNEAIEESRKIREGCLIADKDQMRFEKVLLNVKREKYSLAKTGLDILMKKNGDKPKYLFLYSELLKKLGNLKESEDYFKKYKSSLNL